MSDPKLLHIYGLDGKSGECFIVGNRAGLLVLRHAIQIAIEHDKSVGETVAAADGASYKVTVIMENAHLNAEPWRKMELPYAGGAEAETHPLRPSELWMMKERV